MGDARERRAGDEPEALLSRQPHLREAVSRTARLMGASATCLSRGEPARGYGDVSRRGDYCQVNWKHVAIPPPSQASTVDPALVRRLRDHHHISENVLIKRKEYLTSPALAKVRINLGVKEGHYCMLLERMRTGAMVRFLDAGSGVVENSPFRVW